MAGDERGEQPDLSAFGSAADSDASENEGAEDTRATEVGAEARASEADIDIDDPDARPSLADLDQEERIELGVELLAHLEHESLSLSEAVDRIETITTNPALTREILDTADLRGVIDREEGRIRTRRGGTYVRFEEQVVRRDGDYECRRCGAGLGTGHFVQLAAGELGPFGPECVRRVLGRT